MQNARLTLDAVDRLYAAAGDFGAALARLARLMDSHAWNSNGAYRALLAARHAAD